MGNPEHATEIASLKTGFQVRKTLSPGIGLKFGLLLNIPTSVSADQEKRQLLYKELSLVSGHSL